MTWKQDKLTTLRHYPSIYLEGLGIKMENHEQDNGVSVEIQTTHLLNTRHKHWHKTIPRNTQGGQNVEFFNVKPAGTYVYSDHWAWKV